LEPVQPLLKKFIHFLNNSPPNKEISRPRIQYDRASVWLGIKSLYVLSNTALKREICFMVGYRYYHSFLIHADSMILFLNMGVSAEKDWLP
jgi:hypothetical protein